MHVPELVRIGALDGNINEVKKSDKIEQSNSYFLWKCVAVLQKKKAGASTAKTIQSNFQIKSANQTWKSKWMGYLQINLDKLDAYLHRNGFLKILI